LEDAYAAGAVLGREPWLALLNDRLVELTLDGVAEPFLVQSLTSYVTNQYEYQANNAVISDNRLRAASLYRQVAENSDLLARFRAEQDRGRPDRIALSDAEYIRRLKRFADQTVDLDDPDEAVTRWTVSKAWIEDAATVFPTGVFDHWWLLHTRNHRPV
jgi:hypothetical protein